MATSDAQYGFTWVDIRDCGSNNDAGIYSHSDFANSLENGTFEPPPPQTLPETEIVTPVEFVGDEAFPLKTYLMNPFPRRNLSNQQRFVNYRLSRARRVIENTFGIFVSIWRILRGNICCKLPTAEAIIQALVCLHNFLMTAETKRPPNERRYLTHGLVDEKEQNGVTIPGELRPDPFPVDISQRRGKMGANFAAAVASQQREYLSDFFLWKRVLCHGNGTKYEDTFK